VQWEVNTGSGWANVSNGGVYGGATTDTLTITGAPSTYNGYQYEAVFTNFIGSATTTAATLTVNAATSTSVSSNPMGPLSPDEPVTFTASISGDPGVGTVSFYAGPGLTNQIGSPVNVMVGSATSVSDSSLGAGSYTITAVYSGGTAFQGSQNTLSLSVTSGAAPSISSVAVNGGSYIDQNTGNPVNLSGQNSVVQNLLVTFNEPVSLAAGAFTITPNPGGVTVNSGEQPDTAAVTAHVTELTASSYLVTFSGPGTIAGSGSGPNAQVIDDGLYMLTVHASAVTATATGIHLQSDNTSKFWKLYGSLPGDNSLTGGTIGDGNSEVFVDTGDFSAFQATFGSASSSSSPPYNPYLDGYLSGFVDTSDFSLFQKSFGADWSF
jgi:hypothetical protein